MFYCDTSVLAAYYCPEKLSARVQKVLTAVDRPVISDLVEIEFCSAVALKVRTGDLDPASANRVLSLFQLHQEDKLYSVLSLGKREYHLAREWLCRFTAPLRTLDALHLATAFAADLELITADKQLASSAKALGVKRKLLA